MSFDEIRTDPAICSNCYRRRFDAEEINYFVRNDGYADPVRDSLKEILGDWREYREGEHVPYPEECQGKSFSCECGAFRPSTQVRPVSRSKLQTFAERLVDRADEFDDELNEDAFFDVVHRLKSKPEWQGRDDEILEKAYDGITTNDGSQGVQGRA